MKIQVMPFEVNFKKLFTEKKSDGEIRERYQIEIINTILLGNTYLLLAQYANYMRDWDENFPQRHFTLHVNSSPVLLILENICMSDFEDSPFIKKILVRVKKLHTCIDTVSKLEQLYHALCDNSHKIYTCFSPDADLRNRE